MSFSMPFLPRCIPVPPSSSKTPVRTRVLPERAVGSMTRAPLAASPLATASAVEVSVVVVVVEVVVEVVEVVIVVVVVAAAPAPGEPT
jgi:hypothetical protein